VSWIFIPDGFAEINLSLIKNPATIDASSVTGWIFRVRILTLLSD
jgi:hypothetical protein